MKVNLNDAERFECIIALRMAVADSWKHRRAADKPTLRQNVRAAISAIRKLREARK